MQRAQKGMTIFGLIITLAIIAFLALIVLKVVPVYIEYFTVKKAVAVAAREGPEADSVRKAFERQADIDRIEVIGPRDLEVSNQGVAFAYDKKIPLFANISLYIEFEGMSKAGGGARF